MDNDITWQHTEIVKGSKRTVQTHGLRTSIAKMNLTPHQLQARSDIGVAYDDASRGMGYAALGAKTAKLLETSSGFSDSEMAIDRARKRIGRLNDWRNYCFSMNKRGYVFAVDALERFGQTATSYAEQTGFNRSTVVRWYKSGLDEYANLFYRGK